MTDGETAEIAEDLFRVLLGGGTVEALDARGRQVTDPWRARRFFVPRADVHAALVMRGDELMIDVLADPVSSRARSLLRIIRRFGRSRGLMVRLRIPGRAKRPAGPIAVLLGMAGVDDPEAERSLRAIAKQPRTVGLARAVLASWPGWAVLAEQAERIDPLLARIVRAASRAPGGGRALRRWLRKIARTGTGRESDARDGVSDARKKAGPRAGGTGRLSDGIASRGRS